MSSTESEDELKGVDRGPDPLCLFFYPTGCPHEEDVYVSKQTQHTRERSENGRKPGKKKWLGARLKQEMWLRRRTEVSLKRRRRMLEPGKHLKNYFLVPVKPGGDQQKVYVSCLIEALETLKDAWPPNKRQSIERHIDDNQSPRKKKSFAMIKERTQNQLSRRTSMPEEFMRKYFLDNGISSESETNHTYPDLVTSASPKDQEEKIERNPEQENWKRADIKKDERVVRVTQTDYDKQGKGIIKQKTKEKGSQTGRSTEPSERNDTEDTRTSESLPSSSPIEMPRQSSTSENLSSESDDVKCTCIEVMSSKDTSTDLFRSGNSTLSQTVSEKSTSTQDSTISIHSVSTGGSTVTPGSNSTSSDVIGKTSAKELTSPERTPRVVIFRSRKNVCGLHRGKYPKFMRKRPYRRRRHWGKGRRESTHGKKEKIEEKEQSNKEDKPTEKYKWVKYTDEELYMMQQMRHKKFMENNRFSIPLPASPDTASINACAASGSAYKNMDELDDHILIPRYSALPRTMSMLVNTSSGDTINSDSDSLSLADSLEECPTVHVHHISHDTKKELKPVRGDVNALPEVKKKKKRRHPRPQAFFVSMKDPYGEDELLSGIAKIPEPPERIKERINERQLNILNLHKKNLEKSREGMKEKKRQRKYAREKRNPKELPIRKEKEEDFGKLRHVMKHSSIKNEKAPLHASPERNVEHDRRIRTIRRGISQTELNSKKEKTNGTDKHSAKELKNRSAGMHTINKPQAVIHPSMPALESDQSRRSKHVGLQSRPWRYRQKFEVIPEEKSSSMSSTEEKKTGKRSSILEAPPPVPSIPGNSESGRKYNLGNVSNLVFAKFMEKSLQEMSTGNQPIILVSPKTARSRKGRDALIAMNRGDFNRLSKGWMNFYILKETSDASEESQSEDRIKSSREKNRPYGKAKTSEFFVNEIPENPDVKSEGNVALERETIEMTTPLSEGIRLHSSNTILKPPRESPEKKISLPELKVSSAVGEPEDQQSNLKSSPLVLPKVAHVASECDGMDSDSTVYCHPPSLIMPRLSFVGSGDFSSESSLSETNSDSGEVENKLSKLPIKHFQLRKRGLCQRPRLKRDGPPEPNKRGSQGYPDWSVTVAGTLELTNETPHLEMRLSFPANSCGPPQASQSDSGFAEEGSHNIETSRRKLDREIIMSDGNMTQRWTVTVKNPNQGMEECTKRSVGKVQVLPNIGQSQSRNVKKVLKSQSMEGECHRRISIYWPKVELMENDWADDGNHEGELSVRGSAISMEKKPRPPTMTERDLTRGSAARSFRSEAKFPRK